MKAGALTALRLMIAPDLPFASLLQDTAAEFDYYVVAVWSPNLVRLERGMRATHQHYVRGTRILLGGSNGPFLAEYGSRYPQRIAISKIRPPSGRDTRRHGRYLGTSGCVVSVEQARGSCTGIAATRN